MQSLRNFHYFNSITRSQEEYIQDHILKRFYSADSIVFYQGEATKKIYLLVKGIAKVYKNDSLGNELTLHFFSAPAIIAEMILFSGPSYPATLKSQTDCEIWILDKSVFIKLVEEDTQFAMNVITSMSQKIKILEQTIENNLAKSSLQRVISVILKTPAIFQEHTKAQIASMLHMKPETLSRMLKELKDKHLITINKKSITILDGNALAALM